MHYYLEIVMPPTSDVQAAVKQILEPFDEQGKDEDGTPNRHGFWDFWVIGGRWAGAKLQAMFAPERMQAFRDRLTEEKITVSGVQFGKQELSPADQIPMVDALWCEFFPESPIKVCPMFKHFGDQYKHSDGFPDVMPLADVPKSLRAERVIVAGYHWSKADAYEAAHMTQESFWNGVSHVKSQWDGLLFTAIQEHVDHLDWYTPEYAAKIRPNPDWLAVTVDYHS